MRKVFHFTDSHSSEYLTLKVSINNKKGYVIPLHRSPSQTCDEMWYRKFRKTLVIVKRDPHFVVMLNQNHFQSIIQWRNEEIDICTNTYFAAFLKLH